MKFALNTVVWGEPYASKLIDRSLPTLFSVGNLLDETYRESFVYQLMTTRADFEFIRHASIYKRLAATVEVDVWFIDDIQVDESEATHKYNRVSIAQTVGMRRAADQDCAGIYFLYPDFIYSTGCLAKIAEKLAAGHCAVMCPIPFISQEAIADGAITRLGCEIYTEQGREVSLTPRQLVKLNMARPHPVNRGFDVDSGVYGEWPGVFSWLIAGEGQLIRSFHLHPIGLLIRKDDPSFFVHFEVSLDDEFVSRVYRIDDNFAFIQDSDEFAICSMRGESEPPHTMPGYRGDARRAALWAEEFTGTILRYFTHVPFFWHHEDMESVTWDVMKGRSDEFMNRVRYRLRVPDTILQIEDPESYAARRRRKQHFAHKNLV